MPIFDKYCTLDSMSCYQAGCVLVLEFFPVQYIQYIPEEGNYFWFHKAGFVVRLVLMFVDLGIVRKLDTL